MKMNFAVVAIVVAALVFDDTSAVKLQTNQVKGIPAMLDEKTGNVGDVPDVVISDVKLPGDVLDPTVGDPTC